MDTIHRGFREELEENSDDILEILKSMANEKRLVILTSLIDGNKSFKNLLNISDLKKTSLSNHLKYLEDVKLIEKPSYGIYKITIDGRDYLRAMLNSWKKSYQYQGKNMELEQGRKLSKSFVDNFFRK